MKRVSVISGCVTVLILLMAGHGTRAAMCLPPPVGLVNWWPATGSANDIVGTNHGTLRNGTTFATGVVGQAFSFDGANDFIQIGGTPIAPPWTAEFWVNRQASLEDSAVLIGDTNTALKLEQYPNTKKVGFTKWGLPGGDCSFNYTAPTNTWVHLVFVGNSNNTQLYVNGALQGTNPTNAPFALPRGQMGRDITNRYTKQLRGLVDEPSLYLRALASNEIAALYTAGVAGKCDNYSTNQPLAIFGWGYNYFGQLGNNQKYLAFMHPKTPNHN